MTSSPVFMSTALRIQQHACVTHWRVQCETSCDIAVTVDSALKLSVRTYIQPVRAAANATVILYSTCGQKEMLVLLKEY